MAPITVKLPDESEKLVESGTPVREVVRSIGEGLARAALAAEFNGKCIDLDRPLSESGRLRVITPKMPEGVDIIRHSSAHLMAMAILDLFPGTKLTIGPVIENGFYYDVDSEHKFTPDDFPAIEKRMAELAKQDFPVRRREVPREEAIAYYRSEGRQDPYKVELLEDFTDAVVSFYDQGHFTDLCRGPHVPSTGKLGHFKLLSVAGAYWRGDERRPMLQRIYATSFATKDELERHLHMLEEAKKRDHRKLGRELEYFHIDDSTPGMVFWHPRGWRLYSNLVDYVREKLRRSGYVEVRTPEVVEQGLWIKSGHMQNYSDVMFMTESENRKYVIKPMNCPCHVQIFRQGTKSFRDLPIRMAEFGKCHRNELAGVMHGLMRVRGFTQDDANIFCTEDQIQSEVADFCGLLKDVYADLGFQDILVKLATRPEKRVGSDEVWDKAESALAEACKAASLEYELNPGEGAFYGPKLEFVLKDSLGRHWQCGTIQVDFNMPVRLGAEYMGSDGNRHHPVMLHRAILGSFERFIGILIENYAGDLPLWLNPQQVRILPISQKFMEYAQQVHRRLVEAGFASEVDERNEKIGYKIREGEKDKVPYLIIIGEKEVAEGLLTLRKRKVGDLGAFSLDDVIEKFRLEVLAKNDTASNSSGKVQIA